MKRLLSCLLVVSMVLMGSVNVFAAGDTNVIDVQVEEYNKFESYEWAPIAEYRIIDVPENATEEEKIAAIDSYLDNEIEPQAVEIALYTLVIRSGNRRLVNYILDGREHM